MAFKDAKFDSFLKRTLDRKVYEQVNICEPCVVHSKNEKHTFRFVFLTDDTLFITDNPPKTILFKILFKHLCDVQLIRDTATFLQRELQDIVQHVLVKCKIIENHSLRSNSHRGSLSVKTTSSNSVFKSLWNSVLKRSSKHKDPAGAKRSSLSGFSDSRSTSSNSGSIDANADATLSNLNITKQSGSHADDSMSLSDAGSTGTWYDQQSVSPRDSLKWLASDPYVIDVLESASMSSVEDVHIYILNDASIFFVMLKAVWKRFLLASTSVLSSNNQYTKVHLSSSKDLTSALLPDLKRDILYGFQQSSSMEHLYKYFDELKSISKGNFTVKKYFWKDSDLFTVCGDFLTKYASSESSNQSQRADEIECMVLVCEILSEMLKETESLDSCHEALQKFSNTTFYADLISALVETPSLASSLQYDDELKSLMHDYVIAACDVMFELILSAEHVSWSNPQASQQPIFTSTMLFSLFNFQTDLAVFLTSIMKECVRIWTSSSKNSNSDSSTHFGTINAPESPSSSSDHLTAENVVKLYRYFTVLHRCVAKCKRIEAVAKRAFKEEFKYYIRPENLESKLPAVYPASGITRNIVSAVAAFALDKDDSVLDSGSSIHDTGGSLATFSR